MDYRLDCEAAFADHYQKTTAVDAEGWKQPAPVAKYRVTLAQVLITLAARIAPTVTVPTTNTQALAQ